MHEHYCPAGNHPYDCTLPDCASEDDRGRNCDEHYELVASEGEEEKLGWEEAPPEEKTLYLLTVTSSDNEYDGINYAYITITEAGLLAMQQVVDMFQEWHEQHEVYSAAFPLPDGVTCTMLEDAGEVLYGPGYEDERIEYLTGPLPDEIVMAETDFRFTGADLRLVSGGGVYLKDDYKHDRGGVETAELDLGELKKRMEE